MANKPRVLILTGNGLNCEHESQFAWERAGAEADRVHLHDALEKPDYLSAYRALMFIGGFSYGDRLGSGLAMALRVRNAMRNSLDRFVDAGGLVLGVCNGFQVMVKLGLLPALDGQRFTQTLALMQNDCGTFQNRWVELHFEAKCPCVFTQGLDRMQLPVRHGEGKIFTPNKARLAAVEAAGCVACRYIDPVSGDSARNFPENPNGSLNAIAGLCDPTGRVFGLMPHPEAFLIPHNHPHWHEQPCVPGAPGAGQAIFSNAVQAM
jgi:phosphoribosylformylglycinamidine synthase